MWSPGTCSTRPGSLPECALTDGGGDIGGGPGPAGGGPQIAPEPVINEPVNLASQQRTIHILEGDATGGGHGFGRGIPNKSEFPVADSDALHYISDIATDPAYEFGVEWTPVGNGRYVTTQSRGGLDIRVIFDPNGQGIITGYPVNVPRN